MKKSLLVSLAIASALACSSPVVAEPPGSDYYGSFSQQFLWCRSETDLRELLELRQKDLKASGDLLYKYGLQIINGHSRCFHGWIGEVSVGENKFYKTLYTPEGNRVKTWLVNMGNGSFAFWVFWIEPIAEKSA